MARKQAASKSSGKHATGAGASPKQSKKKQHSAPALITEEKAHLWKMQILRERGYTLQKANQSFMSTVANLHWDNFVLARGAYIEPVVREFYARIVEEEGMEPSYVSMVRGKKVIFNSKKLNEHYVLMYNGIEFEERVESAYKKEMVSVKNRIADEGAVWEKFANAEFKMRSSYMIKELGNWHLFIAASILPTSHTYTLTKERLILMDAILSEGHVYVGRLIAREILACKEKSRGFLFFPCLITELCMKVGVPINANEQRKFPPGPLNAEFKEKIKTVKESTSAVQEHYMQKQVAVWKFQQEQHNWL